MQAKPLAMARDFRLTPYFGRGRRRLLATYLALVVFSCIFAPAAGALPTNFFGLNEVNNSHADFEALRHSGAKYLRFPIGCYKWRKENTAFWAETDHKFEEAWKAGLTVLPFIGGQCETNSAKLPHGSEWEPPFNPYQAFIADLIHRYGYAGSFWTGKEPKLEVGYWEIGNEPNLHENALGSVANGEEYAKFFKRASEYLHEAQGTFFSTSALVGGLYYGPINEKSGDKSPHNFMSEADKVAGFDFWINGVGIHPYAFGENAVPKAETNVNSARADVNTYFGSEKPLWITEVGWPVQVDSSHPYEKSGTGETFQSATLDSQADAIGVFSDWVKSHQAEKKIQSLIIFTYRDSPFFGNKWAEWSGLVGMYEGEQRWFKPSWFKFQEETGISKWSPQVVAVQANTQHLFTWSSIAGGVDQTPGMEAGTSPSVAGLTHGGIWGNGTVISFHGTNGHVFGGTPYTGYSDLGISMAAGTSPSVVGVVHGNYVVAVRGANGDLWTWTTSETSKDRGVTVSPGSSPSVSTGPNGAYVIAFRGANGNLWTWTPGGGSVDRLAGMAANTSPSIAVKTDGSMVISFQANTGNLWTWTLSGGASNRLIGMAAGTSPSIAALPNGEYAIAVQANTGDLWTWTPSESGLNRGLGMAKGTSPSVAAVPAASTAGANWYAVAMQANTGNLWTLSPEGGHDRFLGMAPGTSPATETGSAPFPAPPAE
jgi:hypothetical protein